MKLSIKSATVWAGLGLSASFAMAQAPATPASAPANVGVSNSTAVEANQKAVPRSDTGTVVRTSPSAADRARAATNNVGSNNSVAPSTMSGTTTTTATPGTRAPRSDRN